ncbi:MAG: CoA-binding protein [Gammaproteobacteria bacterium]|nr:CoA-binding protein [Gammaproteobacteria bacterium]
MTSNYETFWQNDCFAVVGDKAKQNFPILTYQGLKKLGKSVFPVDPSVEEIEGDKTYATLDGLPEKVDAVVLEVPKEDTGDWVAKVADAGIKDVWIHMGRETPEALAVARDKGMNARTGTCAVMYVKPEPSYHSIHRWIMKLIGKY